MGGAIRILCKAFHSTIRPRPRVEKYAAIAKLGMGSAQGQGLSTQVAVAVARIAHNRRVLGNRMYELETEINASVPHVRECARKLKAHKNMGALGGVLDHTIRADVRAYLCRVKEHKGLVRHYTNIESLLNTIAQHQTNRMVVKTMVSAKEVMDRLRINPEDAQDVLDQIEEHKAEMGDIDACIRQVSADVDEHELELELDALVEAADIVDAARAATQVCVVRSTVTPRPGAVIQRASTPKPATVAGVIASMPSAPTEDTHPPRSGNEDEHKRPEGVALLA